MPFSIFGGRFKLTDRFRLLFSVGRDIHNSLDDKSNFLMVCRPPANDLTIDSTLDRQHNDADGNQSDSAPIAH